MEQKLVIGKQYKAHHPEVVFDDLDGKDVVIPAQDKNLKVLPKPDMVYVDDGFGEKYEPLPEHLRGPEWYAVKNLDTGHFHWFNATGWECQALTEH
ncbi:TPA: hypothetical protein ACMDQY_004298 [Vibrio parahaemolyticus]